MYVAEVGIYTTYGPSKLSELRTLFSALQLANTKNIDILNDNVLLFSSYMFKGCNQNNLIWEVSPLYIRVKWMRIHEQIYEQIYAGRQ